MKFRTLVIVAATLIAGFVPSNSQAQDAPKPVTSAPASTQKADTAPVVAPITEVEGLRMQLAQLTKELVDLGAAKAAVEKQRDQFRLQWTLTITRPFREAHEYDWSKGQFRRLSDGMVWDYEQNKHVADDMTPKPPAKPEDKPADKPADKPKGGGMP